MHCRQERGVGGMRRLSLPAGFVHNHGLKMDHRDRLSRISESGGISVPLEDYWKEFNSFDEGGQGEEDEEDISKTPDEGEAEEEWLREAGFENLVDSEMTEQDEAEFYEDIMATLTARQIAVVKKRLDTVQMSKKRRVPRSRQRADVRELFNHANASPPESLSTLHSEPLSMSINVDGSNLSTSAPVGERWTRKATLPHQKNHDESPSPQQPSKNTRALPPLPFLRTGHTGGFSLRDRTRGIDCESPTSVEVLRYETRKSTIQDKDTSSLGSFSSSNSTEPLSLDVEISGLGKLKETFN
ncbi:rho GTPase-activating protein 28 [Caerostris darwini]|uniref:Rho GTPase-activating protein 28 n=1 Tax=Caerostris darwini TaxID=1538125 RepID=A0AAV4P3S4_9ARAC|nr:rho GTPase-activating protein 28 [Caerostris darwini]